MARPADGRGTSSHRVAARDEGRFLTIDGVDVHYRVAGQGSPAMLLFHHFYGNVLTWRKVVPGLAEIGTVIAFDRPGFGFTQRPERDTWNASNPYTRAWSADAAVQLLDDLGVDQAVLVGASAGGTSAIEVTHRHPDRVSGLVLISPAITGDVGAPGWLRPVLNHDAIVPVAAALVRRVAGDITPQRVTGGWHDASHVEPADVEAYSRPLEVEGWAHGLVEAMTAEPPPRLTPVLGDLEVPVLVVTGAHDRTISPRASRRTAERIPGAVFHEIPGCGHTPHEECPGRLVRVIKSFLRSSLQR